MKNVMEYIIEKLDNWKISNNASIFMKDCVYDILSSGEYDIENENYQDLIKLIIKSINDLDDYRKYIPLKNVLKKYPDTYFRNEIDKIIEEEIKKFKNKS